MGSGRECIYKNTTIDALYKMVIDEKMVEGAFKLPNELPKTSKKYIINSDGLLNADYKIERVKRLK